MFKRKHKTNKPTRSTSLGPRQQIGVRRTLPVDRYYSSASSYRRSANADRPRRPGIDNTQSSISDIKRLSAHTAGQIFATGLRWSGIIAIIVIVIFNLVLSTVGVKVTPPQSENLYRQDKDYVNVANDVFKSSLLHKTKATFDSSSYENSLKQSLPEIETATAVVPLVGLKLQVGLQIASPLARLQTDTVSQGVIASNGMLVLKQDSTSIASKYSQLPLMRLEPVVSLTPGQLILTTEETELVVLLKSEFDGSSPGRPALESIVYSVAKRELTARFSGVQYAVKCTTAERDARSQVGAALATIDQLGEQGKLPQEYIDVRVNGRVFVK